MKTIHVVAAVIIENGKVFATQRGYGELKDGWEFPGGKIEAGETPEQALVREIREELDTEVEVQELINTVEYDYPDFHLSMECFRCRIKSGNLILKEHEAARWLTEDTIESVAWLPADIGIVQEIKSRLSKDLTNRFTFRSILPEEAEQAAAIEQICFPPNEACSEKHMKERITAAPDLFLVAVDKATGKIAGFLNGLSTNESSFRDEFFTDAGLFDPAGKNIMLLGLDVLPEYRMQGLARELVYQYLRRERERGRCLALLTCLSSKVEMYKKLGFTDRGIANSSWGGEEWHEMSCVIG